MRSSTSSRIPLRGACSRPDRASFKRRHDGSYAPRRVVGGQKLIWSGRRDFCRPTAHRLRTGRPRPFSRPPQRCLRCRCQCPAESQSPPSDGRSPPGPTTSTCSTWRTDAWALGTASSHHPDPCKKRLNKEPGGPQGWGEAASQVRAPTGTLLIKIRRLALASAETRRQIPRADQSELSERR